MAGSSSRKTSARANGRGAKQNGAAAGKELDVATLRVRFPVLSRRIDVLNRLGCRKRTGSESRGTQEGVP